MFPLKALDVVSIGCDNLGPRAPVAPTNIGRSHLGPIPSIILCGLSASRRQHTAFPKVTVTSDFDILVNLSGSMETKSLLPAFRSFVLRLHHFLRPAIYIHFGYCPILLSDLNAIDLLPLCHL